MQRVIYLVLVIVMAVASGMGQSASNNDIELSAAEKTKMVKHVFDAAFMELFEHASFLACLTPVVKDQKIILLEADLDEEMLPTDFDGFRFVKINHSELRKELLSNDGGCYFILQDPRPYKEGVRVFLTRERRGIFHFQDSEKLSESFFARSIYYDFVMVNDEWTEQNRGFMTIQN